MLCHLWLQRHPNWKAVGVVFGAIFQGPGCSIFDDPYKEITTFSSFLDVFLKVAFGRPLGIGLWAVGVHVAPI